MKGRKHKPEQIVRKLRAAVRLLGGEGGRSIPVRTLALSRPRHPGSLEKRGKVG
jgi:hypothetical protein